MIRTLYLARANATLVDAEGNYIFNDYLFYSLVAGGFLIEMLLVGLSQIFEDEVCYNLLLLLVRSNSNASGC